MTRRQLTFRQSDLTRALRAMAQAGVRAAVKLTPDGNMWIVPDPHGGNPQVAKEQIAVEREAVF